MKYFVFLGLFLGTFFYSCRKDDIEPLSDREAKIYSQALRYQGDNKNSGVAIGVVSGERTNFYCLGKTDNPDCPNITPNSLFEIGSITKVFTALLLSDLVVEHHLSLNDTLGGLLPELNNKELSGISLKQLVTHSSGLPRMPSNFDSEVTDTFNPYKSYGQLQFDEYLKKASLLFPPGKHYLYSNLGFALLGQIVTAKEGLSYKELLRRRILDPFGMKNTFVSTSGFTSDSLAYGHDSGERVPNWEFTEATVGQGAIVSSANEMVKFIKANLYPSSKEKEAVLLMQKKLFSDPDLNKTLCMGWHVGYVNSWNYLEHTGATGGYRSLIGIIPQQKLGLIILSNSSKDISDMAIGILRILSGEREPGL